MDGVLYALKHYSLLCVRKGGGNDSNSAIFYLSIFLYKNAVLNVKKKIKNLNKKQWLTMKINYFLQINRNK